MADDELRAAAADTGFAPPGETDRGPLESRPPIIVYTRDVDRLREYGIANGCGDSAVALHRLLEERDAIIAWLKTSEATQVVTALGRPRVRAEDVGFVLRAAAAALKYRKDRPDGA